MELKNLNTVAIGGASTFGVDTLQVSNGFTDFSNINLDSSMFVSLIGGVVATVVLNVLKAKFPKLFRPVRVKKSR